MTKAMRKPERFVHSIDSCIDGRAFSLGTFGLS
jgi:hypothetical protein